jgi:hypothetical protein
MTGVQKLGVAVTTLLSCFAGNARAEELILGIGSRKDAFGGGFPTASVVRFDSTNSNAALEFEIVMSDLFWISDLAVSAAKVAYVPGSSGLIEAVDVSRGASHTSLGPVDINLSGFPSDMEFGGDGRLLIASNNIIASLGDGNSDIVQTNPYWGISAVDTDAEGNFVFWENTTRSVMRATPGGEVDVLVSGMEETVVDLKLTENGSVYLATLPYGRWAGEELTFEGKPSRILGLSSDGKTQETIFSPLDFESCTDCTYEDINISDMHVGTDGSLFVSYNVRGPASRSRLVNLHPDGNVLANWHLEEFSIIALDGMSGHTESKSVPAASSRPFGALAADTNLDGVIDVADMDLLTSTLRAGGGVDARFDLNSDGVVDQADRNFFVRVVASTFYGDANLDGAFNSLDLVAAFQSGEYNDSVNDNSTWAEGDWSGDGDFDSTDVILALQSGGYFEGIGTVGEGELVPEPTSAVLMLLGIMALCRCRFRA